MKWLTQDSEQKKSSMEDNYKQKGLVLLNYDTMDRYGWFDHPLGHIERGSLTPAYV